MCKTRYNVIKLYKFYQQIQLNKLFINWMHINTRINPIETQVHTCPECAKDTNTVQHFYECEILNVQ